MKRGLVAAAFALLIASSVNAQLKAISVQQGPGTSETTGSAAIDAGDYVYVAAQGPKGPGGQISANFSEQVKQSLDNIKGVVAAAGLTMENVAYVQVYLSDATKYAELDKAFAAYFPKVPPARGVMGVARVPEGVVQINAIAVRDLDGKKAVALPNAKANPAFSAGILTHDRMFVSTMLGADPVSGKIPDDPGAQVDLALDGMKNVLEAAGLTMANMVFVNPYMTSEIPAKVMNEKYAKRFEFGNTPGRATIHVTSLQNGTHIAYTGVAVRDLKQRRSIRPKNMPPSPTASPCVFAGDTLFCSAKSGFIPGPNSGVYGATTTDQARQTMRNLLDNLEEADMKYDEVVFTTVYLDDLTDTASFNKIYKKFFSGAMPAQTTVQQISPVGESARKADEEGRYPDIEQMSLIAVKSKAKN